MPMLVILGGRDGMLDSHDTRRRLQAAVSHVNVRFLPDAGHVLRDQTEPILRFLSDAGPSVTDC